MTSTRLSPEKWIDAGFAALIAHGPASLAAEPLARALGTTKGSFYWHFKDVPAYHAALVRDWHTNALSEVMQQLSSGITLRRQHFGFGRKAMQSLPRAYAR